MLQTSPRASSKELMRNFGKLADEAVREPVVITKAGRDRLVLVSIETFEKLTRSAQEAGRHVDGEGGKSDD